MTLLLRGSGALPTGGLLTAAPRTRSSVPADSGAHAALQQPTVSGVEELVGEVLRFPEKTWQQNLSLGPELPRFTNQAVFVEGTRAGTAPHPRTQPTL